MVRRKSVQLTFPTVDINGRTRTIVNTPAGSPTEALSQATADPYGFYRANIRNSQGRITRTNLSERSIRRADNLKRSMVEYARQYGNAEQVKEIQQMDSGRLQWMYDNGLIQAEEFFRYDESNVGKLGTKKKHRAGARVQRYIDMYDAMEQRGLEARRERSTARRARRAAERAGSS